MGSHRVGHDWSNLAAAAAAYKSESTSFERQGFAKTQPRDWTQVSCMAGSFFTVWATRKAQFWPWSLLKIRFFFKGSYILSKTSAIEHSWVKPICWENWNYLDNWGFLFPYPSLRALLNTLAASGCLGYRNETELVPSRRWQSSQGECRELGE